MTPILSHLKTCIALAAALGVLLAGCPAASAADLSFRCVNSASGASWTVMVDDQKLTADGAPAQITSARISWRDAATGGFYNLDRKSGALTFTNPSSTGGYMLFHRCQITK